MPPQSSLKPSTLFSDTTFTGVCPCKQEHASGVWPCYVLSNHSCLVGACYAHLSATEPFSLHLSASRLAFSPFHDASCRPRLSSAAYNRVAVLVVEVAAFALLPAIVDANVHKTDSAQAQTAFVRGCHGFALRQHLLLVNFKQKRVPAAPPVAMRISEKKKEGRS